MSFWIFLEKGSTELNRETRGKKLALYIGRKLALRDKNVTIDETCMISPQSRINARGGKIVLGAETLVAANAVIQGNVRMGTNCSVQWNSFLCGYPGGEITIGNDVRIAPNCMLVAANHKFDAVDRPITEQGLDAKPITIEDDVWIGGRVNIMAGVTIGKGSVIGAGSVVTKDIPPYSVAVGVPAKVVKRRL